MKKKALLISLLPILLLASCKWDYHDVYAPLTYGTQIEVTVDTLPELTSDELYAKVEKNECFILAVHQGEYSADCLCWSTFKTVITNFMNSSHEIVYIFNAQEQTNDLKDLEIKKFKESTPMLYVFYGSQKIASYSYNKAKDKSIFNDTTGVSMYKALNKVAKAPQLFYVDKKTLDQKIEESETMTVLFIRNACEDCKYVLPNVIIPYINEQFLKKQIYLFDLQEYFDKQSIPEVSSAPYDGIKSHYGLSETGNASYGYGSGVVPTIQHYNNGVLSDASVYFNDEIAQKEDGSYYISESYYSDERLTSLKYLDKVENKVLKGMALPNDEVLQTESGRLFWKQEKAAFYHTPLLKAFLNKYN